MFYVIILYCSGRILVFYGVCTHLLCLFSPGSGQIIDIMDIVLGPVASERKGVKNKKIVNLELTNNSRRKPTAIGTYCKFNDQLYGRTILVHPYSCRRIVAIEAAASNSFAPWNWIRETTYRTPRNRRNLTSERDLEGELIHRGSIFIIRRSRRLRHRSSSATATSPPSTSP